MNVRNFEHGKVERKRDEKLYRARLGGFYLMVLSDFLLVMGLILELTFRTGHLFEVILPFSFIISTVFIVIIIIKRLVHTYVYHFEIQRIIYRIRL